MAQYDGSIRINTGINTNGISKGLSRIKGEFAGAAGTINKGFAGVAGTAKKLGVVIAAAFSVRAVAQFGAAVIEAASDLEAMESQFTQVFGDLEKQAGKSLSRIAEQAGIAEDRMKASFTKIAAFAKTTGMDTAGALELADRAMIAVADSAAFYDRSLEETTESLQSFLKGNFENDAALGLSCTETTRNAAANRLYAKSFQDLSESQKQLTLLQMVEDANRLSGALGQAARESDTWTNQIGNLKQAWTSLKANLGKMILPAAVQAVKAVTNVINSINAMISRLSVAAGAFRSFSELITGNKAKSGSGVPSGGSDEAASGYSSAAEAAENLADSIDKVAQSTKKAKEETEKYLSPLDEINRYEEKEDLPDSGSAGAGGSAGSVDYGSLAEGETVLDELGEKALKLKEILSGLIKPFRDAWEAEGAATVSAASYAFESLGQLVQSVGESLYEVWTNGTGTQTLELALQIVQNIFNTVGAIAEKLNEAWNTNSLGTSIIQNIFNLLNIILGTVERITGATAEWARKLDFTPLLESVNGLLEALAPLTENIGAGLEWFYTNVLLPYAQWKIEDYIPAFLDMMSAAIGALNAAIEALKPLGQWIWEEFLQPLGEWTGDAYIEAMHTITELLEDLGSWIDEHQSGFQAITVTLLTFFAAFKAVGAITSFIAAVSGLQASLKLLASGGLLNSVSTIGKLINAFALAAGGAGTLHEAFVAVFGSIGTVLAGIGSVVTGVVTAAVNFLAMLKDGFSWVNEALMVLGVALAAVGAVILGAPAAVAAVVAGIVAAVATLVVVVKDNWNAICEFFAGAAEWFNTNVVEPVVHFFKGLWKSVSGFFSGLWDDIKAIWKGVSDWFNTNVIGPVSGFFQGFSERVGKIFEGLWIIVQAIWIIVSGWFDTNVIQPVVGFFTGLMQSVSKIFSDLWDSVQNIWKTVSNWFQTNVTDPVTGFFKNVWTSVSGFFSDLWSGIQKIWQGVADWFSRTVIDPVKNAWERATEAIGGFFFGLWQGIANGVVSAMNCVIRGIESGINFIVDGINNILTGFNSVVSWAASIVGVDWSGVALVPSVSIPKISIPALATGAVIPPNKEFLAVLGDQKHGTNIEAPEGLLRKIIREEAQGVQTQNSGGNATYRFVAQINRRTLLDEIIDEARLRQTISGNNPFELI